MVAVVGLSHFVIRCDQLTGGIDNKVKFLGHLLLIPIVISGAFLILCRLAVMLDFIFFLIIAVPIVLAFVGFLCRVYAEYENGGD